MPDPIASLPAEISLRILLELPLGALATFQAVSPTWRNLIQTHDALVFSRASGYDISISGGNGGPEVALKNLLAERRGRYFGTSSWHESVDDWRTFCELPSAALQPTLACLSSVYTCALWLTLGAGPVRKARDRRFSLGIELIPRPGDLCPTIIAHPSGSLGASRPTYKSGSLSRQATPREFGLQIWTRTSHSGRCLKRCVFLCAGFSRERRHPLTSLTSAHPESGQRGPTRISNMPTV